MPLDELSPTLPTAALQAHARELLTHLGSQEARFVLWDKDGGQQIELSSELYGMLRSILIDLSQNRAVQILPLTLELTTVQAAEFLNVSRPHVIKLIEDKKLSCRMVGTHRRIRLDELMNFAQSMQRQAEKTLAEMTNDAEAAGWGY